jgi:hypothetical protein
MAIPLIIPLVAAGAQIGGSVFSFLQAGKARDREKEAQRQAARALAQAKQELEVNYMEGLSIAKEPYELEREALNQAAASAIQAGVEGDQRGAAATAGRVLQAQQRALAQQRASMSQEMSQLERLVAQEDARLGTARASVDLGEATGAQAAAQDAALMAQYNTQQGIQQGVEGLTSLATSGLFESTPEGMANRADRKANRQLDRLRSTDEFKANELRAEQNKSFQLLSNQATNNLNNTINFKPIEFTAPTPLISTQSGLTNRIDPEAFRYDLSGQIQY